MCSSLSAPFTGSAESTRPTRMSTFTKSSMVILRGLFGGGLRRAGALPSSAACRAGFLLFERAHLLDGRLGLDAREHGRHLADLLARLQLAPLQARCSRTDSSGSAMPSCAQIFAADSGSTGASSTVAMRSTSAAV